MSKKVPDGNPNDEKADEPKIIIVGAGENAHALATLRNMHHRVGSVTEVPIALVDDERRSSLGFHTTRPTKQCPVCKKQHSSKHLCCSGHCARELKRGQRPPK